ncbi:biopolymer transporter ExbD [Marinihelvus fidelis]|uniref:Biopolymer transporter ExbD n=1 Tax=Marinihelvus fidelis TaxID=2613842 RepID=A0A5N0TC07_9GAMM|nr:biopolymer transporter ExbD [Marinihelvus fidelis]KAA9131944.1 biopolymer transporter ExbD [Marinihelvus fidelis]
MQLNPRKEEEPEINMTSLIDVVFLLLIFFMVSTTFERQAALKIDLPEASAQEEPTEQPRQLELAIDAEGRMFLNDAQLVDNRPATIRSALAELAGEGRELPIIIRADAQTPHHFVVTAMDVTGQLGFTRLSIATERVDDAQP